MITENPRPIPYPLYQKSFHLYRVSPLFTGDAVPPRNASLSQFARRFREILDGEVLRGVSLGPIAGEQVWGNAGALRAVTWETLPNDDAWGCPATEEPPRNSGGAILVTVAYERTTYWAILVHHTYGHDNIENVAATSPDVSEGFHFFPLLLIKMPAPLRQVFTGFLAKNFDTRISSLHLSSLDLRNVCERYIVHLRGVDASASMPRAIAPSPLIKDTIITLGFSLPDGSTLLKTIEIRIGREDLVQMMAQHLPSKDMPFFGPLAAYLKEHLALDLWNPTVKIVRITCGNVLLAGEGRLKLTQPLSGAEGDVQRRATRSLMQIIVKAAMGDFWSGYMPIA